jgi:hypothetical protein
MAEVEAKSGKRTPKGARLPQVDLLSVVPLATVVAEFAGSITRPVLAQHLKMSPASGSFKNKIAAAKYYGLLEQKGDQISITARGQGAVDGDVDAMRQAVLSTGFGSLIRQFAARAADADVLSSRLKMDLGVPEGSSRALADTLIAAAAQAGLASNGLFDAAAIQGVQIEHEPVPPRPPRAETKRREPAPPSAAPRVQNAAMPSPKADVERQGFGRAPVQELHIDVQVHIASDSSPEQIDQIFASMAKHLYGTESGE